MCLPVCSVMFVPMISITGCLRDILIELAGWFNLSVLLIAFPCCVLAGSSVVLSMPSLTQDSDEDEHGL